jgi:hypothetical protein
MDPFHKIKNQKNKNYNKKLKTKNKKKRFEENKFFKSNCF